MKAHPLIQTERLLLREFRDADASRLAAIAGEWRVADTTICIPHPFSPQKAIENIVRFRREWELEIAVHFAVCAGGDAEPFVGYVALRDIDIEHGCAELSFWISESCGGKGYATEASLAVIRFGFDTLCLSRICAYHMVRNPASATVLAKLGMREEGRLRQRVRKWGVFEDVLVWAVVRTEWQLAWAST